MKKVIAPLFIAIVFLISLMPGVVQAAGEIDISAHSYNIGFPDSVTFSLNVASDVNITDIRLHYTVNHTSFARVISEAIVSFQPSKSVSTQWVLDMRKIGGIPPGTEITYWWTVTDSAGKQDETLPDALSFDDNNHDWQELVEGLVTLYWYDGDTSFASELMDGARQALAKLADNTGASLAAPARFYIYGTQSDFLSALINPQEWTGGVAFSQYNCIMIPIGTSSSEIAYGVRTISHELTHLVEYQVTANPYNSLPPWLSEGLAMYSEGDLQMAFVIAFSQAYTDGTFISVRSLCSPFSSQTDQALLAYAESHQIVTYLIVYHGKDKFFQLLEAFHNGSDYDAALQSVYGFDIDGLNTNWQTALQESMRTQ